MLPEGTDPFERLTLGSVPRVLRTLCARGGCPFTHDAVADLDAARARGRCTAAGSTPTVVRGQPS